MKFILLIFVLICIVSVTLGSTSRSFQFDPENPDNCLVGGKSYPPGMHTNPDPTTCERVECSKGGSSEVATCGVQMRENCKDAGLLDVSLPYPECCAIKWDCPEQVETEN